MRILVTNTQKLQAYYIVLGLRSHAEWIVAATDRPRSYAAYSKYVDARYGIPTPNVDFEVGRLQNSNTEAEQEYIKAILDICTKENIDTIIPSNEPDIYVLSKNKHTLKDLGLIVTVPDFDKLLPLIDKAETFRLAQESGFPCPRTILFEEGTDVHQTGRETAWETIPGKAARVCCRYLRPGQREQATPSERSSLDKGMQQVHEELRAGKFRARPAEDTRLARCARVSL